MSVQNIGLLMTCNEEDVLPETMESISRFFDKILVLDGSTDKSEEIIRSYDCVHYFLKEQDIFPVRKVKDGIRQFLLEKAQADFGTEGWFTLLHGDEIFIDDPNKVAIRAQKAKAERVNWHALNFFLHRSQIDEDFSTPMRVQDRVLFYQPGSLEIRQFRNKPGIYYDLNQATDVVPKGIGHRTYLDFPIFKHYIHRSPEQMKKKFAPRMARYDGEFRLDDCFTDVYRDELKVVRKYDGSFHEFEPQNRPSFFRQWLSWRKYRTLS